MKSNKWRWMVGLAILSLSVGLGVWADDDDDEEHGEHGARVRGRVSALTIRELPLVSNSKWKNECASCHMLYLPGLLPQRSWVKMMNGLESHFGENASLDEVTKKEITDFLVANSADHSTSRRSQKIAASIPAAEVPLAFSETYYFKRKHHEIGTSIYKRKAIGSPANCMACHRGAEQGVFDEEAVRIPK